MTLLSVVQEACPFIGVEVPEALFSNPDRTHRELVAHANEMAKRIAYDHRDWQVLRKFLEYRGEIALGKPLTLPVDYLRMPVTANVWRSSTPREPMRFINDPDDWVRRRLNEEVDPRGEWLISGGQMHFHPEITGDVDVSFVYIINTIIDLESGGLSDRFIADGDRFIIDERLLKLGLIASWKQSKGSPYAEDLATFQDAMAIAQGHDTPAPILIDRLPISAATRTSYPYPVTGPAWPFP